MAKILSITLNPAIDLTVQLDQLKVGEVNRQLTAQSHAAGKGLNVAQVLKDLGHELIVSGFWGKTTVKFLTIISSKSNLITNLFMLQVKHDKTLKLQKLLVR